MKKKDKELLVLSTKIDENLNVKMSLMFEVEHYL
jgi:hypothetical protein